MTNNSQRIWPDSERTRELLAAARDGDQQAVEGLMDRHRDALRKLVGHRMDRAIGRRVDASDVVQDVLLEASNRLANYLDQPALPFHLWLRQLARDRMIDMHRRHRQAQRRSVDRERSLAARAHSGQSSLDLAARLADAELTPVAASIRRELQLRYHEAIEELAEDDREILLMRHFEQLTNSEAAEALELSPAAAGMRHLRALRRLKDQLENSASS
ncbi:MAG: sigma-70 family RNA polymerase sigma factor [Planctomycetota bacterium]|nr:sigma-70 family RNA polymerase sigma factor [Planctomycetota bacterium]